MVYSGDTHQFVLSITKSDGSDPLVTATPTITVVRLRDQVALVTAQAMTLITGTQEIYTYAWHTTGVEDGDYLAFVSYATDGVVVTSRYLDRVRIGDARVTGVVAQDATVAKDGTVAKDATVAKASAVGQLPTMSETLARIESKVNQLPVRPADEATLEVLEAMLQDVKDAELGTWIIDKTVNPKVLSLRRLDGTTLAQYQLSEDDVTAVRSKI